MPQNSGITIPFSDAALRKKEKKDDVDYLFYRIEHLLPIKQLKKLKLDEIQKKFLKEDTTIKALLKTDAISKSMAKYLTAQSKRSMQGKKRTIKSKYFGMEDYLDTLDKWLPNSVKAEMTSNELNKKSEERLKAIDELLRANIISPDHARYMRIKNKLTLQYEKFFIKQKWFKNVSDKLTNIGKSIADSAGSWFWKIISFIAGMAIFDPQGEMLGKLIDTIGNAISKVFEKINLNKFIDNVINVITIAIPKLVNKIFGSIANPISILFKKFANLFPKDSKTYEILMMISGWFGPKGVILNFVKNISKYMPQILAVILALGALDKIGPQIVSIITAITTSIKDIMSFAIEHKWELMALAGALGLAMAGRKSEIKEKEVKKETEIKLKKEVEKRSKGKTGAEKKAYEFITPTERLKKQDEIRQQKRIEEDKKLIENKRSENIINRPKMLSRPKDNNVGKTTSDYSYA